MANIGNYFKKVDAQNSGPLPTGFEIAAALRSGREERLGRGREFHASRAASEGKENPSGDSNEE